MTLFQSCEFTVLFAGIIFFSMQVNSGAQPPIPKIGAMLEDLPLTCPVIMKEDMSLDETGVGRLLGDVLEQHIGSVAKKWPDMESQLAQLQTCGGSTIADLCKSVEPGYWCLKYQNKALGQECVIIDVDSPNFPTEAMKLQCPPGFYCTGTTASPKVCPKGYNCSAGAPTPGSCEDGHFCLLSGAPLSCNSEDPSVPGDFAKLLKGTICLDNKKGRNQSKIVAPEPCPAGYFCTNGSQQICPKGNFCPAGQFKPIKCRGIEFCPEGSISSDRLLRAILEFLLASVVTVIAGFSAAQVLGREYFKVSVAGGFLVLVVLWCFELLRATEPMIAHPLFLTAWIFLLFYGCVAYPLIHEKLAFVGPAHIVLEFAFALLTGIILWAVQVTDAYTVMFYGTCWITVFLAERVQHYGAADTWQQILVGCILTTVFLATPYFIMAQKLSETIASYIIVAFLQAPDIIRAVWQLLTMTKSEQEGREKIRQIKMKSTIISPWGYGPPIHIKRESLTLEMTQLKSTPLAKGDDSDWTSSADQAVESGRTSSPGVGITLDSLGLYLPNGKAILNDISLTIPGNSTVAVMGPSGSGKSSITNVLSGRSGYGIVKGRIVVNNNPDGPGLDMLGQISGFVPQDDIMHRNLTVFENVLFQAELRMPLWAQAVTGTVAGAAEVVKQMGLSHVSDSLIGDEKVRGISGGQRKRVSIGMELVAKPSLLFLDEPTSGLDSTTSHEVIRIVTALSKENHCTSIAVIHQPRFETLQQFDDVVLLAAGGYLAYAGPVGTAIDFFQSQLRVTFPAMANPADVFMDAISLESAKQLKENSRMDAPATGMESPDSFGAWLAETWTSVASKYAHSASSAKQPLPDLCPERCSWGECVLTYLRRASRQMRREIMGSFVYSGMTALGVLAITNAIPHDALMQTALVLFFLCLVQGVQGQKIFGGNERFVAWRESGVGANSILYFCGKDMAATIEIYFASAIFASLYWPMSALDVSHHRVLWASFAVSYATWGMSFIFSIIMDPGTGQIVSVVASFVCFLMAGLEPAWYKMISIGDGFALRIMSMSPVRWGLGYLFRQHLDRGTQFDNALIREMSQSRLEWLGIPLWWVRDADNLARGSCSQSLLLSVEDSWFGCAIRGGEVENKAVRNVCHMEEHKDRPPNCLVCTLKHLFLLGLQYRCIALMCLIVISKTRVRGGVPQDVWARVARMSFIVAFIALTRLQTACFIQTSAFSSI